MRESLRAITWGLLWSWTIAPGCAQQPSPTVRRPAPNEREAGAIEPRALEALLDSVIPRGMTAEHIPGAVFTLVQDGRVVFAKGYGFADMNAKRPVSPDSTIFRIGSITKLFTATAVVQLADRGRLQLGRDVNDYLKRLQVPKTYAEPVTATHLLSHTPGFDELPGVRQARSADALVPLHEFLRDKLVRVRPPGRVTAYSSFGMALAGLLVEEVSGLSYEDYLRQNVWKPLGMHGTYITPGGTPVGYDYADEAVTRAPYEWYHTFPASSINSSATDMARFMIAHLEGGGPILSQRATREMHRRHATMHPRMPGWALGFQENDLNGERIVEHGGDIAGFSSLLVLLPDRRTGFFVAHHREGSNLRFTVERAVLDRFFPDRGVPEKLPSPAGEWALPERFVGTYRWNIYCRTCGASAQQLPTFAVTANDDGSISVNGKRWIEVSPLFFRSTEGKQRLGFAADSTGRVMHLTGGSWMVMERVR
jgi:CubicO group peptidase (beta-lactamase class C family)